MNDNKKQVIIHFYQVFTEVALGVLQKNLDRDEFKNSSFDVISLENVTDSRALCEGNVIYKTKYAIGLNENNINILLPEKLLSVIADVLMGGRGDKEYEGSLSELEINAVVPLLQKILKEIESEFDRLYSKNLTFNNAATQFVTKEKPEYEQEAKNAFFDFAVNQYFMISEDFSFNIIILTKYEKLMMILESLSLIKLEQKKPVGQTISLENLSGIKIGVTAELGRAQFALKSALSVTKGSFVKLDTIDGQDISVFANNVEVAKAQIVVVGEHFGLRITKIISPEERMKTI